MKIKRILSVILAIVMAVMMSSCGKPIEASNAGLTVTLPAGLSEETDQEKVKDHIDEVLSPSLGSLTLPEIDLSGNVGSDKVGTDDFIAMNWFDGSKYNASITSMQVPFVESDFKDCIKAMYGNETGEYRDITTPEGYPGRCGSYSLSSDSKTYAIEVLHNGIIYSINFYMSNADSEMSDEDLDEIIQSITIGDFELPEKEVQCGDLTMTLPGSYIQLKTSPQIGMQDHSAFGSYTTYMTQVSINYYDASSYQPPENLAQIVADAAGGEIVKKSEAIGDVWYVVGEYNGYKDGVALFTKGDKTYMIEMMTDGDSLTADDISPFVASLK